MSDFLARLAARAVGGDASLMPRLPSLFEPLQRAPIMALPDAGDTPMHPVGKAPDPFAAVAARRPPTPATEPPQRRAAPVVPVVGRKAIPEPAPAVATSARVAARPSLVMPVSLRVAAVERSAAPPHLADLSQARLPLPVQPGRTRVAPGRDEAMPAVGSLLPAPGKVFTAQHVLSEPARSGPTAGSHGRNAQTDGQHGTIGEAVVHVSIGRLEVRAAPVAAQPPARRRAGAQPASLDDYLRQRGDKVSP